MEFVAWCGVERKRVEQVWGRRVSPKLRDFAKTFDAGLYSLVVHTESSAE